MQCVPAEEHKRISTQLEEQEQGHADIINALRDAGVPMGDEPHVQDAITAIGILSDRCAMLLEFCDGIAGREMTFTDSESVRGYNQAMRMVAEDFKEIRELVAP